MNDKYYLINYTVNGIKNICKDVNIEFYKKIVNKDFNPKEYSVKAIYGENGTGKSGIITSVKILKNLILNKYYLSDSSNLHLLKDLINKKTNELKLEVGFVSYGDKAPIIFKYLISIKYDNLTSHFYIKYEELKRKEANSKTWKTIYSILDGEIKEAYEKNLFNELNKENGSDTLKEQSFISNFYIKNAANYLKNSLDDLNSKEEVLISSILYCMFFAMNIYVYLDDKDKYDNYLANIKINEYLKNFDKTDVFPNMRREALNDSMISGHNIRIRNSGFSAFCADVNNIYKFVHIFKPDLKKIEIRSTQDKEYYICDLIFVYDDYSVDYLFESNGVKKLVNLYKALEAVDMGSIVFIDEFDSNIHDVYLCRLIEYIKEYAKGQLCFTTQSITIMDVLKDRKKSIDFLSRDGDVVTWVKNANYVVSNMYKEGYIEKSPFNIDSFDFLEAFGDIADEQ